MEHTKEEIQATLKVIEDYDNSNIGKTDMISISYLKKVLLAQIKSKTKFIDVRIEFPSDLNLTAQRVELGIIDNYNGYERYNTTVTELPETFTKEDMTEFAKYAYGHTYRDSYELCFKKFLSERKLR